MVFISRKAANKCCYRNATTPNNSSRGNQGSGSSATCCVFWTRCMSTAIAILIVLAVSHSDILLGEKLEHTLLEDAAPPNSQQTAAAVSDFSDVNGIDHVSLRTTRTAGAYHKPLPEMPSVFLETETHGESDASNDATSKTTRTHLRKRNAHEQTKSATPPSGRQQILPQQPQNHEHESNRPQEDDEEGDVDNSSYPPEATTTTKADNSDLVTWQQFEEIGRNGGTASSTTTSKATLEIEKDSSNETFAALDWRSPDEDDHSSQLSETSESKLSVDEEEGYNKTETATGSSTFSSELSSSNSTGPIARSNDDVPTNNNNHSNTTGSTLGGGASLLGAGEAGPWHTTGPQLHDHDDDNNEEEIEQTEAPEETTGPQQQQQLDEDEESIG